MQWLRRILSTPIITVAMLALTLPAWAASENNHTSPPPYAMTTEVVIAQGTVTVVPAGPLVAVVPQGSQVVIAPTAPPPPAQVEVIPAPPATTAQVVEWQPGHWGWNGATWTWIPGQYAPRAWVGSVWVPGQWIQQSNGDYAWSPSHWS